MPFATRERIWEELPPLDGEPEVKVEKKEVHEEVDGVDTVKTIEIRTSTVRKLKCVEERKKWELFGLSDEDIKANDGMSESEEVVWEYPQTEKQFQKKQNDKKEFDEVKCRFCGGSHFSHQCPRKNAEAEPAETQTTPKPASASTSSSSSTGKYSVRDHISSASSFSGRNEEGYKIRINNLSEDATKGDVLRLCEKFGTILRCFVKPGYNGSGNVGFANVTFAHKEEAEKACERLNGHHYGHLILSVEMAKPIQ